MRKIIFDRSLVRDPDIFVYFSTEWHYAECSKLQSRLWKLGCWQCISTFLELIINRVWPKKKSDSLCSNIALYCKLFSSSIPARHELEQNLQIQNEISARGTIKLLPFSTFARRRDAILSSLSHLSKNCSISTLFYIRAIFDTSAKQSETHMLKRCIKNYYLVISYIIKY